MNCNSDKNASKIANTQQDTLVVTKADTISRNTNINSEKNDSSTLTKSIFPTEYGTSMVDTNKSDFEITSFYGYPDEVEGCSCSFSETETDYKNKRYFYIDDYGFSTSFISINGKIIKQNPQKDSLNFFRIKINFDSTETKYTQGDELWWKTGTITITSKKGISKTKKIVGECGC